MRALYMFMRRIGGGDKSKRKQYKYGHEGKYRKGGVYI